MKLCIACVFAVMVLTACSNALVMPESKLTQVEGMRCRQVTPTGSHRPRRVCTTRVDRETDAVKAQAELEEALDYQRNREMQGRMDHREMSRP